jgi:hypothetical protein
MTSELTSMGYRQIDPRYRLWLKPIGYAVLVYSEDRDELCLQFRGESKSWLYGSESPVTFLGLAESNLLLGGASFLANEPGYAFTTEN